MTEHTKTDGMPAMDGVPDLQFLERSAPRNERMAVVVDADVKAYLNECARFAPLLGAPEAASGGG